MTRNPRLLVTGAGGSIGRRLRARLEADGYDASFVVSPRSGDGTDDPAVDAVEITDGDQMSAVVARRRPTAIIHLASITGGACDSDPERAEAVNVDAVGALAELAKGAGVARLVFASSSAVYGDQYDSPIDEQGATVLGSRYATTKRRAELALAAAATSEFTVVALRIFNVYGPGMADSLANRLVRATADAPVSLAGLDTFVRDYVHVDDVVQALLSAAEAPLSDAWAIINVASGHATSNRELVAALEPVVFTVSEPRASYSCANVAAARRLLGFVASRPLNRSSVG